ncbi:hypothetical protein SBRY_40871 [Actinacidiphila bryophytorum]|uniref:Uncharacterized protein n=1 Tax=Actinacidiphila bryophytorum TaxID=1436133 RepID=A0A9W4H3U0_9ACTN|nr:hypothetical protein SBRY_40871 [Actinacidiphila bryophytorum]
MVPHRPAAERHLPRGRGGAGRSAVPGLRRGRRGRRAAPRPYRLRPPPAAQRPDRARRRPRERCGRDLLRLRPAAGRRHRHHPAAAAAAQDAAARRPGLPGAAALHPAPQPRRAATARPGVRPRLGGADRKARLGPVHARPLAELAQAEMRGRAGAGRRRLHRAVRQPGRLRRPAAGLPPGRAAAVRGQGRHRLRHRDPAVAARPARRDRGGPPALRRARQGAGRPLGAARTRRAGRLHRVDPRRPPAPPPLPGAARGQGGGRRGPRDPAGALNAARVADRRRHTGPAAAGR